MFSCIDLTWADSGRAHVPTPPNPPHSTPPSPARPSPTPLSPPQHTPPRTHPHPTHHDYSCSSYLLPEILACGRQAAVCRRAPCHAADLEALANSLRASSPTSTGVVLERVLAWAEEVAGHVVVDEPAPEDGRLGMGRLDSATAAGASATGAVAPTALHNSLPPWEYARERHPVTWGVWRWVAECQFCPSKYGVGQIEQPKGWSTTVKACNECMERRASPLRRQQRGWGVPLYV